MGSCSESTDFFRPSHIDNKVVVIDGMYGGAKQLLCHIVASLPTVEMWLYKSVFEQICSVFHLQKVALPAAAMLIKLAIDEEFYNVSLLRNSNFRLSDYSSVWYYRRKLGLFKRLVNKNDDGLLDDAINKKRVIPFMTHCNTPYARPVFEALDNRLVYIRMVRSPMSDYMLNHTAQWTTRWSKDIKSTMPTVSNNSDISRMVPFFVKNHEIDNFLELPPLERAVWTIKEWQLEGDRQVDQMRREYRAQVIEVPFEKFVFDPLRYVNQISSALEVKEDSVTLKEMRRQRVPRRSLTDSPYFEIFSQLGWKKPVKHQTVTEELEMTRKEMKAVLSTEMFSALEEIAEIYLTRYSIG